MSTLLQAVRTSHAEIEHQEESLPEVLKTPQTTAGETSKKIWPNISETILRDSNRSVLSMFGGKMECCSTLETHGETHQG